MRTACLTTMFALCAADPANTAPATHTLIKIRGYYFTMQIQIYSIKHKTGTVKTSFAFNIILAVGAAS